MAILQGAQITGSIIATTFIKANGFSGSITASNLYVLGKAGIGTSSPTAKLEVVNTERILGVLRTQVTPQTTFYDNTFVTNNDGGGAQGFIYTSGTGGTFPLDTYGELILQSCPKTGFNNGISLVTGTTSPSVKLRIAEGGNVGIGTTSPANNLVVYNGSGWAGEDLNGTSGGELIFRQSGTLKANIYASTSTGFVLNGASETIFQIGSSEKMRIDSSGNILIGGTSTTNSPIEFQQDGDALIKRLFVTTTSGNVYAYINSQDGYESWIQFGGQTNYNNGVIKYSDASNFMSFWTNTTEKMRITSGGNVGIGTTAPAYNLDVTGSISADSFLGKSFGMTGASGSTAIYDAYVSAGAGEVYELIAAGSPNAGGSSGYRDVLYGKIIIGTGYNGSAVTTYINYVQENPDPRSLYNSGLGTSLSASICFKSGSSEVTNKPAGQSTKIRVKIGSYINNAYAGYTTVRVKRLF